ncbi:MAG: uL15m family ribosomal protein [Patescibacteria group bacterium]
MSKKRVGRGYGSGKGGHTTGRGQKGQKSRGGLGVLFEGYKVKKSLLRRLPISRGKDKFKPRPKPLSVNIEALNILSTGAKIDVETLAKAGIINLADAKESGVKILGSGKLTKRLDLALPASKSVVLQITKLKGKILI